MIVLPKAKQISVICINVSVAFCTKLEHKILQFLWKHKTPPIAKAILRKKNKAWRDQASWLKIILQNYSNQDIRELAQKQKYRSME